MSPKISKASNGKIILLAKCPIYNSKNQDLLNIKTPLNRIPLFCDTFLKRYQRIFYADLLKSIVTMPQGVFK